MPPFKKDDTEIIIRSLLKLPENRRCINCNTLGPQYVCTTFSTFVCTSCSGVHREFSHRVKSVSMAKFSEDEITALQAGGNERAREIYFKAWDPQRHALPDSGDLHKLREFIRYVYKDRGYAGTNNSSSVAMIHEPDSRDSYNEHSSRGVRNDFLRRLSFDKISSALGDKGFAAGREREMDIKNIFEERSPRSIQGSPKSGSQRGRSNIRFEIVDDRFREDGSVKRYERRSSRQPRSGSSSPASQRGTPTHLPAVVPVNEPVCEKAVELRVGESPKPNNEENADGSARGQKTGDDVLPAQAGAKQEQDKIVNPSSLIDFDVKTEPSQNKAEPQANVTAPDDYKESSSVAPSTPQTAANPLNMNSIELLLLDWSYPVTSSDSTSHTPESASAAQPNCFEATDSETLKEQDVSSSPRALTNTATEYDDRVMPSSNQDPNMHMDRIQNQSSVQKSQQTFASPATNSCHNAPNGALFVKAFRNQNQQLSNTFTSNDQTLVKTVPLEQSSQDVCSRDESTTIARKELPQYLFTSHFNSFTPEVAGWHYGMHIQHTAMPVAAFPNPSRPRNPFDIADEGFQAQPTNFPSMPLFHGAQPNMPVSTALVPQPPPYATAFASHLPHYGMMNMPQVPGAYIGQQPTNMPPTRPQGNVDFGRSEEAFASLNSIQQARGTYYFPASPNTPASKGGNPFG